MNSSPRPVSPSSSRPGIGLPYGDSVGWSSSSSSRRSTVSDITCSQRHASACTSSQSRPITSVSSRSASRCLRITRVASRMPSSVSSRWRSPSTVTQAVALHAGHGLGDGRAALVQPLGDPGTQRDDAFLDQLIDRPEVHLGGVDQVAHRPFLPIAHTGWQSRSNALGDVVPARPAPRGQPGAAGGRAARRRGAARSSCIDPALWRPAGPSATRLPGRVAARISTAASGSDRCVHGDPVAEVVPRRPARSAPTGCTSPPTSAPTVTRRDERRRGGTGRARHRAGPHRVAVRRRPGPGDQRTTGDAVPRLHAVLQGLGATHGWRPPAADPAPSPGVAADSTAPPPSRPGPRRPRPPRGRRGRRARRRWQRLPGPTPSPTTTDDRDRPGLDAHLAAVGAPEVGRDPPAHAARRPRPRCAARAPATYRKELAWREFYADVLFAPARDGPRLPAGPSSPRMAYDEPGDAARRLAARAAPAIPIVDAGMRQLRRDGLDAQPGPDDRGQLPGQGPAPRVAARRPALPALAGRRRPGLQPARLAVGGRQRHRRGAVLPGLQPRSARAGSSTRTATTSAAGCPSSTRTVPEPDDASDGLPDPIVDHAEERREALDRWERIRA